MFIKVRTTSKDHLYSAKYEIFNTHYIVSVEKHHIDKDAVTIIFTHGSLTVYESFERMMTLLNAN